MIAFAALVIALDAKLCPLAPAPQLWSETVSFSFDRRSHRSSAPNSVQVAARLVDLRAQNQPTIGWLYLDEHGNDYVSLVPNVDERLYLALHMESNEYRDTYSEAILQPQLRLPSGIELRSCTQDHA